jgi:allophanate hydrolase subunit 2
MSLLVTRVVGLITIQDFGRVGHMHEGLSHGGALVPELLTRANRAVRNPDATAAVEILGRITVRAESSIEIATDSSAPQIFRTGDEFTVGSEPRRVAYLAVRGGVDAPVSLGSRATHLSAGLGSLLRAGTRISAGSVPSAETQLTPFDDRQTIRVVPGPDGLDLAPLTAGIYTVLPTSDRVGTRLEGPVLPRGPEATRPMVRGAIEVPGDGQPIVLGPEHPTTGGYPLIGVIASADLGRFFAIRVGGSVRFVVV